MEEINGDGRRIDMFRTMNLDEMLMFHFFDCKATANAKPILNGNKEAGIVIFYDWHGR